MGVNYEPKNNFSFTQKQKIISYMYFKNNSDLQKGRIFTYLNVETQNTKESIQNRIDHLKEMKEYNRTYFVYNLARCQNRLRTIGKVSRLSLVSNLMLRVYLGICYQCCSLEYFDVEVKHNKKSQRGCIYHPLFRLEFSEN